MAKEKGKGKEKEKEKEKGKLGREEVAAGLERLPGWRREGDTIQRSYEFPDFRTALAFVVYVGELAEQAGHHPDVELGYGKVRLALSTHSAGGLTEKDLSLARAIDHANRRQDADGGVATGLK